MVKDHQRAVQDKAVLGPRRGQSEQDAEMRRAADILDL
jgi:hypothetical protein